MRGLPRRGLLVRGLPHEGIVMMLASPTTLVAEVTYRCPLRCPYCSNPLEMSRSAAELSTEDWMRVVTQARALGVLQLGISGGEPLVRADLEPIVASARQAGLYTSLITSGLGLSTARAASLRDAGVDHMQLSLQDSNRDGAERIAGTRSWDRKLEAAKVIKALGIAFTINVVLHRANLDHLESIISLAESMGADRLELANTQYYGWAVPNRRALMPTRDQVNRSLDIVDRATERLRGTMQILYVLPDFHGQDPKPCMGGWGNRYIVVAPDGATLPCQAARSITSLSFDNVRDHSLQWIWQSSSAFNAFRGDAWMQPVCRACARKELDFGGCRCQAFLLTGDATSTDPVCALSPHRAMIDQALAEDVEEQYVYRTMRMTPSQ